MPLKININQLSLSRKKHLHVILVTSESHIINLLNYNFLSKIVYQYIESLPLFLEEYYFLSCIFFKLIIGSHGSRSDGNSIGFIEEMFKSGFMAMFKKSSLSHALVDNT